MTTRDATLGAVIRETLRLREQMRAQGATPAEQDAYVERVVRASWPQERAWHYLCEECRDTGLVIVVCAHGRRCHGLSTRTDTPAGRPGKYRRLCVTPSDYTHDDGVACHCQAGARFRVARPVDTDDLDRVAKAPRPTTRWGR